MNINFLKSKISNRISFLLFLILIITIGAFTIFQVHNFTYESKKILSHNTTLLGKTIEKLLRINMVEQQCQGVNLAVQQFREDKNIRQMRLYDHTGKIVYATDSIKVGTIISIENYPCKSCHAENNFDKKLLKELSQETQIVEDSNIISVIVPVNNSTSCIDNDCHIHSPDQSILGLLTIDVYTESILGELELSQKILVGLSLIVIFLITFVVYLLLKYWLTRPVQEIVKGTQRVAAGNFDEPIPPGQAEIGDLAESFNNMQAQLKVTHRHLLMCEKLASVGKLAAGVAHEINNPLTGILTFSESLLEETPIEDPRRGDYEVIRQQSLRSRDIVRKILDFARQDEPQTKKVQINTIIDNTISLIRRLSQFQNIQIVTRFDESIPETLVDPGQIEQVVLNMLMNSSEAITSGGKTEVTTSLSQSRNEIVITIKDDGAGIEKENLTKIFDPFFSTKKKVDRSNSGLGLSVSWGIIEQHRGRIEVESKIGIGTSFRIILPVQSG